MPCSYFIDTDGASAELTAFGKVTLDEVMQRFDRLFNDPEWVSGYSVISDYSSADLRHVTPGDLDALLELAVQMRRKFRHSKFAIIVASALQVAFFRMWNLKGGENIMEMQCFKSRSKALEWLHQEELVGAGVS